MDSVIDSPGGVPFVFDATTTLSHINTDTINIGAERKPGDVLTLLNPVTIKVVQPEGGNGLSSVKYSVAFDESSTILGEGTLSDNGISPDLVQNDGIYSGNAQFQFERVLVGKLTLSIWSENNAGNKSNTYLLPLILMRLNHPPVISDLSAPDSLSLSITNTFYIQLKATDIDGQGDIKSVLRFTPSGKILPLQAVNDSIYAEWVTLVPAPSVGPYLFHFRAVDRSNDTSNVIAHTILIKN